jgi:hypothetical protein
VSAEAPREQRHWYEMPAVWIAFLGGALLALVLTAGNRGALPSQQREQPARTERTQQTAPQPSASVSIPPVVQADDAAAANAPDEPEEEAASP